MIENIKTGGICVSLIAKCLVAVMVYDTAVAVGNY